MRMKNYADIIVTAFPYSFQILGMPLVSFRVCVAERVTNPRTHVGMAGGMLTTLIIGLSVLYTSHVLWR